MHALQDMPISFPGLFGDWSFNPNVKLLNIGNGIYWYGVLICLGVILAILFCAKQAPKYGITEDNLYELVIWALPFSVIGARIYYVIFYLDLYRNSDGSFNWGRAVAIWDGGLAIYGGIIAAVIVLLIFTKVKKLSPGALMDVGVMGLFIGQAVGRWGNFFNREAFGCETTLPWRMRLWTSATEYIEVHPTFFYESLWNLIGFLILWRIVSKFRSFDGENTCFYFAWYSFGRFWIEGLRTDSLYLFDWTIAGQPIRVSQALSLVLFLAATITLIVVRSRHPNPENLFVTRRAKAEAAAQAESFLAQQQAEATAEAPVDFHSVPDQKEQNPEEGASAEEASEPPAPAGEDFAPETPFAPTESSEEDPEKKES